MIVKKNFWGFFLILISILEFRCGAVNETQKAYEAKDYHKTLTLAKQTLRIDSTNAESWMWMAKAYIALDSLDKASASIEKALTRYPTDAKPTTQAVQLYLQIGDRLRGNADNSLARSYYEKVEKHNPKSVDALMRLAEMDEKEGRLKEAQRRYETLIDLSADPTQYATKVNLLESKIRFAEESFQAGMDAFRSKDYDQAESAFSKALEAYPAKTDAAYYLHLSEGIQLYKKATPKARKSAKSALQKAADINPKAAEPHFWTARLWEMENNHNLLKNAIEEYETALKLEPDGPLAKDCAEKIRTLKTNKKKMDDFWNRGRE